MSAPPPCPVEFMVDHAQALAAECGCPFVQAYAALAVVMIAGLRAIDEGATQDLLLALAQHEGARPLQQAAGLEAALARLSYAAERADQEGA